MKNKTFYLICYYAFSTSIFFLFSSAWAMFSCLCIAPVVILSGALSFFFFSKMKKLVKTYRIIKDIFPLFTWVSAITAASMYVEMVYNVSGAEAAKHIIGWEIIFLFIGIMIINKLFDLFYRKGNTDE